MVSRVARADLALDAPVKGGDRGWSRDRVAPAFPRRGSSGAGGTQKKKATTSQNGGNSARTSAATVAKLPLCPVCSASTVVPRATKA